MCTSLRPAVASQPRPLLTQLRLDQAAQGKATNDIRSKYGSGALAAVLGGSRSTRGRGGGGGGDGSASEGSDLDLD